MKLNGVELRRIQMPLVAPFRTSFGTETCRDVLLVRVVTDEAEGWGECVAMSDPLYSSEYVDAAADVLRRFFIPAVAAHRRLDATLVGPALAPFKGHRMAKAALETAVLDAELRAAGRPLARELGAVRETVPCGVSVGIMDSVGALLDYRRITGGLVAMSADLGADGEVERGKVVTKRAPTEAELKTLAFAWRVSKHVKSNAIVLAQADERVQRTVGVGAGQMSRVVSVEIALKKAGDLAKGSVLASDAFFPFPDGVEAAAKGGVIAIAQPGGSIKDADVIAACDAMNVAMVFTGIRHFRH